MRGFELTITDAMGSEYIYQRELNGKQRRYR